MRKWLKMIFLIIAVLVLTGGIALYFSTENFTQFGGSVKGERLTHLRKSPNYRDGKFHNQKPVNMTPDLRGVWEMTTRWLFGKEKREPKQQLPVMNSDPASSTTDSTNSLRVIWLGHSSVLVEIDGVRLLLDPVWSERCSPSILWGPKRFHPPPIELDKLPDLDAVLISHDHYDHLDKMVIDALAPRGVRFFVPLGVGAHLEKWGVPTEQIIEMDWGDTHDLAGSDLRLVATPAQHFSGRKPLWGMNETLWVTWTIIGPRHRVFFSGDTGEFPGLAEIGAKYGPFDLTLIKIGAYGEQWPEVHLNPEQAVVAHLALKGNLLLPIHWGTFNLAFHDWFEPPERLVKAAQVQRVHLVIPRPGQPITPSNPLPVDFWWREQM